MMDDALEKLRERFERDPDSLVFAQYADQLRKAGDYDEAIRVLELGLQKHPNYATGYLVLGRCYREMGNFQSAMEQLQRAVELDSQSILANRELAEVYVRLEKTENAITTL